MQAWKSGARVGAVGSKLYDYHHPDRVQFDGDRVCYQGVPVRQRPETEKIAFKTYVSGASVLLPRKALEECGGFDEAFFLYFEDNDLCLRFHNSGWRVAFHPKSIVYHKGGASIGEWIGSPLSIYYATRNFLLFQTKHGSVDLGAFRRLRDMIWSPMAKDRASIRAFLKGLADFSSLRFGRTVPEAILEGWTEANGDCRDGIPHQVLQRLEDLLAQDPSALNALETLFELALAAYEKLTATGPRACYVHP